MRYALYFAPRPQTQLHALGSAWLGRDAFTGASLRQPETLTQDLTADACRYGFHATLKPPFTLADGIEAEALASACERFAAAQPAFGVQLKVSLLDDFLALVPAGDAALLAALAARCVEGFERFRKPASPAERQKRRQAGLSPRQDANLERWGYPYVLEDFRFHITLSGRLPSQHAGSLMEAARAHFAPSLAGPAAIDALTLFREAVPGEPFAALHQFPFRQPAAEAP